MAQQKTEFDFPLMDVRLVYIGCIMGMIAVQPLLLLLAVLAFVQSRTAPDFQASHLRYVYRSIAVTFAVWIVALLLAFNSNAFNAPLSQETLAAPGLVVAVWLAWYLVRIVGGLVRAAQNKPITNPDTWLWSL